MTGRVRIAPLRRKQSGLILLLLVGVLGLGATYMMLRAFNVAAEFGNSRQLKNALILEEAKAALLMYVSAQVTKITSGVWDEPYPGKLPCPEDTSKIGTANEGQTKTYCSLPAVGRLPWKTLGYATAPVDMDGEELWYGVSPGFNRASSGTTLTINSNTTAGLTVDDSPARAVALIFSPGRALPGQSRSTVTSASPPVASNYLDLENATLDIKFATHGPAGSVSTVFNDQVAIVSHQDLFAVVEPAVAKRLSDTLVNGTKPLTSIYASSSWGASAAAPVFPYAAPFANPVTATYQGINGTTQGLLPLTFSTNSASQNCSTATDGVRCDPTFVQWISFQSIASQSGSMTLYPTPAPSCTVTASLLSCTIYTSTTGTPCNSSTGLTIKLVATASNVAMALRQLDSTAPYLYGSGICSSGDSSSAIINSDGSAQISFIGRVSDPGTLSGANTCPDASSPYKCQIRTFSIPIRVLADHPIVNSSDSEYGWFTKNEWHKLTYYAIAPAFAASGTRSCTAPNCLAITNLSTTPTDNKRAILILAGRPIAVQTRSSGALSDYLESENLSPIDNTFVTLKPSREFNDRVIVVDSN